MITLLVIGLATGSIYALAGFAFNMMYATSKVLSMNTGHMVMIGGIFGAYFIGVSGWPIWLGALVTIIAGGLLGAITELLAIRRILEKTEQHLWVLSTLAFGIIVQESFGIWWGTEPTAFPEIFGSGYVGLLNPKYYAPMILAVLMLVGVELFYKRTIYGKAFLAVSQDTYAARARGIPVSRVRLVSYILSGIIGAAAGFTAGQLTFAYFAIGHNITLYGFIALAVGGLGSNVGALLGGWLLGIIMETANYLIGGIYMDAVALVILIGVLLVVPKGIFGVEGVRRV